MNWNHTRQRNDLIYHPSINKILEIPKPSPIDVNFKEDGDHI